MSHQALITGGAGFLGSNYTYHLLDEGWDVTILDDFSRGVGCESNVEWLRTHKRSARLATTKGDVRNSGSVAQLMKGKDLVVHAAAQTSVPFSVKNPKHDFEVNVIGTLNVLEAARQSDVGAFIFVGSNKVYGDGGLGLKELATRLDYSKSTIGINETLPVRPEDPYGLSKAVGESYALMYHKLYGLPVSALRFSLMYGPRQWGKEEQGFVAWFCAAHVLGSPIRIYGNGKQVRDLLYIDDAVSAVDLTVERIKKVRGECLNCGGGRRNAVSLLELLSYLGEIACKRPRLTFTDWREHDVRCFYTDNRKATERLGWSPKVAWREGVKSLYNFISDNSGFLRLMYPPTQKRNHYR